jgi:hypothetical protein
VSFVKKLLSPGAGGAVGVVVPCTGAFTRGATAVLKEATEELTTLRPVEAEVLKEATEELTTLRPVEAEVLKEATEELTTLRPVEAEVLSDAIDTDPPATCSMYSVICVTDQSATTQLFTPKFLRPVAPTSRITGNCLGALVAGQFATWSYRTVSQARLSEIVKLM